jgi:tetratricopeptide (TPR) repeat protein
MLETVREHALLLLGREGPAIEERHARHFLSLAEDAYMRFASREQTAVTALLDAERGNLDAALETFRRTGAGEHELRLANALWAYWRVRGRTSDARATLDRALRNHTGVDDHLRLHALQGAAILADSQGDYEASTRLAHESVSLARATGAHAFEAKAYTVLASAAIEREDFDEAATLSLQAVELLGHDHDARDRAFALINLGNVELNRRRFAECERFSRQSVELLRNLDDPLQAATPLFNIGLAALETGDVDNAESHLWESFSLTCQLGHGEFIANGLDALAAIHNQRGAHDRAIPELAAAAALRSEAGVEAQRFEAALHERTTTTLRNITGDERFDHLAARAYENPWGVVADTLSAAPQLGGGTRDG